MSTQFKANASEITTVFAL